MEQLDYLKLLAERYPTREAVAAEITNLKAICCLPKGTEYFFSDLHGEYEAFVYLLNSASGIIRDKIGVLFGRAVAEEELSQLAGLIYEPQAVLAAVRREREAAAFSKWCRITVYRLVQVCKTISSKYTRSKVRKKMPASFAYIIDELLHADTQENKEEYHEEIIRSVIETGMENEFIEALCQLIRDCSIDRLHILGDIFDRGPHADIILNALTRFHHVDVEWGNHDIYWMGAAMGNGACIANVIRLGISYNNFDLLEDGYGINLRPLSMFAAQTYAEDPCTVFMPHILDENTYDPVDIPLAAKMHKAIAVIQFKLEGQLIARHPEYHMEDRILLDKVAFDKGTITIEGREYPLTDRMFPTIDPANPLVLSEGEQELIQTLTVSFLHSHLLQKHVRFLFSHGGMYRCVNGNLLYHGCIPMTEEGGFDLIPLDGQLRSGKAYLDAIQTKVHAAYYMEPGALRQEAADFLWYLWCGAKSPLFGKSKLSAFERYFIADKRTHQEVYNPYYNLIEDRRCCEEILRAFGLSPEHSHIVNGHVPVKLRQGESPVKGGGLLFMIDGGLSKAYQSHTGIGGYTLISNSHHLALAEHRPFESVPKSLTDRAPKVQIVERMKRRILVGDTDNGKQIRERITALEQLLRAYREGCVEEKRES